MESIKERQEAVAGLKVGLLTMHDFDDPSRYNEPYGVHVAISYTS